MNKKIYFVIIGFVIVIAVISLILVSFSNKKESDVPEVLLIETNEETQKEIQEAVDKTLVEKLSGLSEQKRIEYYATEFIKALEGRKISTAYNMLNEDFKKNYFSTEESFGEYVKTYFPKEVAVSYANMERLENIYVLEVEIKDILNSVNPNHFDCYIVVKENGYADYELSFSVDSAMKNSEDVEDTEEIEYENSDIIYEADEEFSEDVEDADVIDKVEDEIVEENVDIEEFEDTDDVEETEE